MSLDKSITALEMKKYELRVKLIDFRRKIEYLKEKDELQTPPSLHERESTVEYAEEKNELSLPPARDEHEDAEQLSRPEEHDGTMTCRDSPLLTGCEVVECFSGAKRNVNMMRRSHQTRLALARRPLIVKSRCVHSMQRT